MRLIICTKRDLAGCLVLNEVMPRLAGCQVMVLLSDKTRPVETAVPELAEMKFLERDLPVNTLFPLVEAAAGQGGAPAPLATFNGIAARHGVPIKVVADINGPDGERLVRDFAPDLILSARFSLIFKPNIFDIPRFGTYNIHPGALPRYAGLFAPFRCMMEGGERIGCTLHRVDAGIDTGPVVGIGWLPIRRDRSLLWHVVHTYRPGLGLFLTMLERLRAGGTIEPIHQDSRQRVYGGLPDAMAFRTFRAKGFRLFDHGEYLDIIAGFLPPGMAVPDAVAASLAGRGGAEQEEVGASCCFARA